MAGIKIEQKTMFKDIVNLLKQLVQKDIYSYKQNTG